MASSPIDQVATSTPARPRSMTRFAVLAASYAFLAIVVRIWPRTRSDIAVTRKLQSNDHPAIERFMTFVSWFGFRPQSLFLPLSVISAFWWRGRHIEAGLLVLAWLSSMASFLTKQIVRRPRPDNSTVRVVVAKTRDSSFPSGHVVHYVTFWGFVAWLLAFRTGGRLGPTISKWSIAPIIGLVGPSRIYLGHHWFTDVVGSYLLGGAWLSGLIELHRILHSSQSREHRKHSRGPEVEQ